MRFAVELVRYGGANAAYWMSDRAQIMEVCTGIVKARRLWMRGGWHPPNEDPRQG
jgi:hypothetical protein